MTVYSLFVSHSWTDTDSLRRLKVLLETRGYFKVDFQEASRDVPINSENASYIKARLKKMISQSDAILAIAGVYATHSDWMAWELDTASVFNKPIIGIRPWGQQRISRRVSEKAVEIVAWQTESIVDAIRRQVI